MSEPADDPTRHLPPLPPAVQDELLDILFGDPAARPSRLEALRARQPAEVGAIDAHLAAHEQGRRGNGERFPEIHGYRIRRCISEGGMGIVYDAEQVAPLQRRVAIKVVKALAPGIELGARFELERQALARMEHEAIAKVYDCGTTSAGQPFFAMEYVDGLPIDRYADERRLPLRARIALFLQVCRGVQHAHQKGIVHRDLKPSNVLVGDRDGGAVVKVIDFGVARALEQPRALRHTELGQLVGTPEYMSPEQAAGEVDCVDTRSDVYSLGAMLYELLSGMMPFAGVDGGPPSLREMREQLQSGRVPLPSARVEQHAARAANGAANRATTVAHLRRSLAGDLDWILLRAMEHDPERRYPSAIALADDLQRYLDGLPVTAGPPTTWYRVRKFARRYRGALSAATLVVTAIVAGLVGTSLALARADAERSRFDLLANVVALRDARNLESTIGPDAARSAPALTAWVRDYAEPLLAARAPVAAAVAALRGAGVDLRSGDRVLCEQLAALVPELDVFAARDVPAMRARQRWAERLAALQGSERWVRAWQRARQAVRAADDVLASRLYAATPIDLVPQDGLWPMGMNPATKLWEFYDLRSAVDLAQGDDPAALKLPTYGDAEQVAADGTGGMVFVLIPGGHFHFSAQNHDPKAPNYDRDMPPGGRTFEVELAPFLLSRWELTQGQWRRLGGAAVAFYPVGKEAPGLFPPVTERHPMEEVSEADCEALLARHGLVLPTEVQWEYACRAGTTTPWSWGAEVASLRGHANVLDARTKGIVPQWTDAEVPWDDGFLIHAPVGRFPANAFGLFDMHGNVGEWCRDGSESEATFARGDGRQLAAEDGKRVFRGGSFQAGASVARCAWRKPMPRDWQSHDLGCRAARALDH